MKKSAYALIAAACFAGVFGALEADHFLIHHGQDQQPAIQFVNAQSPSPASFTEGQSQEPADFRTAAKKVMPSVVSVDQYRDVQDMFGEDLGVQQTATGSGVVLSKDGVIVTNNHVVAEASYVQVRFPDKRTLRAKVLGTDPRSDLAVLKVDASNLVPATLGDSTQVAIGQWVIAVGNPLGYDNTVSAGVVSSMGRSLSPEGKTVLLNAIQTDAAINPGNSGGALADAEGNVIGINSAIASNTGGSVGIGFAIPINVVKDVSTQIVKTGKVAYGILGVRLNPQGDAILQRQDARQEIQQKTGAEPPKDGVLLFPGAVDPTSAAGAAGIKDLDVLLAVDGKSLDTTVDFYQAMVGKKPGDKVTVKFWDAGKEKTVTVTLRAEQSNI